MRGDRTPPAFRVSMPPSCALEQAEDAAKQPRAAGVEAQGAPRRVQHLQEPFDRRSEEHTSELQSPCNLVCRLLLEKKKNTNKQPALPLRERDPKKQARPAARRPAKQGTGARLLVDGIHHEADRLTGHDYMSRSVGG